MLFMGMGGLLEYELYYEAYNENVMIPINNNIKNTVNIINYVLVVHKQKHIDKKLGRKRISHYRRIEKRILHQILFRHRLNV